MILYSYFRSSAAYRVRIALNLKNIQAEYRFVHLVQGGGHQHSLEYRMLNPQGRVPFLIDSLIGANEASEVRLAQSWAILEYLEETHPSPALLPQDPAGRARVRSIAQTIVADMQPLQNLSVTQYLERQLAIDEPRRGAWVTHFNELGLTVLETNLAREAATGRFCHGDAPTLADCCLVPQLFAARRFGVDLRPFPTLVRIDAECQTLEAFQRAAPASQPDAE